MIYILDESPALTAQHLDDAGLSQQIEDIAPVLCNVHHIHIGNSIPVGTYGVEFLHQKVPIKFLDLLGEGIPEWTKWAFECDENYHYTVKMAIYALHEYNFRLRQCHSRSNIIDWARLNVPDLPCNNVLDADVITPFPLTVPDDFLGYSIIDSYRNYYQHNISKAEPIWSRREKPTWLEIKL